jgi:glyoxylase-like metal-dependent hydrolase (beta-lactamase superfamily II)
MLYLQSFVCNPFSENSYILYNENKNAYIIDPGNFTQNETDSISNFINKNELKVKGILLTHAHIDHVLGLQWAYNKYDCPVLLHPLEKEILDRNPMTAQQFGFKFSAFSGEIIFVDENKTLILDDDELKVYFVPGHSPGSIAFHCVKQNFVISGDVLFQGSIGRTDLYKGNHEQLLESIRTQLFVLNDETEVFSGHGNSTTIGFEKLHNPFF